MVAMKPLAQPIAVGRTAEIIPWEDGAVLKLFRDWCPPDWVDYEARIARTVEEAGVPSPRVGEIVEVNGRRGIVYERVEGPSMLRAMSRQPLRLAAFGRTLAQLQLAMHRRPVPGLPDMRGRIAYSIKNAGALPDAKREKALQILERLPGGDRLCHGDFHPDNVLLTPRGPLVIDWMNAAKGHPAADVARTRLLLTIGSPLNHGLERLLILLGRRLFCSAYDSEYRRCSPEVFRLSADFLPVMAAARLHEKISPETEKLLAMIPS